MADVVNLRKDEEPPDNGNWILVEAIPSGRSDSGPVTHTRGATFYLVPPKSLDDTIADATAWADKQGIKRVFVRGKDT